MSKSDGLKTAKQYRTEQERLKARRAGSNKQALSKAGKIRKIVRDRKLTLVALNGMLLDLELDENSETEFNKL